MEKLEPSYIAAEMWNGAAALKNNLIVSQNVKHTVVHVLVTSLEDNENLYSHKSLYVNIHSSNVHNGQKVETTQMPVK